MATPKKQQRSNPTAATAAEYAQQVKTEMKSAWLPFIYRDRVRKMRTRAYRFDKIKKHAKVQIQHTLLGVELKVGSRRLLCPDLATARYLSVFALSGCEEVAVPYDITKVSQLADELESSWHRTMLLADLLVAGASEVLRTRVRKMLATMISQEVLAAGAGNTMPEFRQTTSQRK